MLPGHTPRPSQGSSNKHGCLAHVGVGLFVTSLPVTQTSEVGKDWCLSAEELGVGQNFRPSPNFKLFSLYLQFQMGCRQNLGFRHCILKIKISKFNLWVISVVVNICLCEAETGRFCLEENFPIVTKAVKVLRGRAVKFAQILLEKKTTWNVINVVFIKGCYSVSYFLLSHSIYV